MPRDHDDWNTPGARTSGAHEAATAAAELRGSWACQPSRINWERVGGDELLQIVPWKVPIASDHSRRRRRTAGIAFGWIGATIAFGSVVGNP